ncbi:MAG: PAS domain S-box-containing protein [Saprospiraceae bacterium]
MEHNLYNEAKNLFSGDFSTTQDSSMHEEVSNFESYHKILLVEDNPGDARLVELLLMESDLLNCKIDHKTHLSDAITALEEAGDYAAILLDLTLPDSRGFETLEKILDKFPEKNVIVLTGLSDKNLGLNAVKAGAQDFLIKGAFDSDLLAKTLRYSIERSSVLLRLEETQRLSHIGSWEFNPETKEFKASNEVFRIFAYSGRKNITALDELKNADASFNIFDKIHEEALSGNVVKKDIQIALSSGQKRYIFIQCQTNTNTESKLVLSGIIQDITERKISEQELFQSQERYQDIFTKSKDAIFICTNEGQLVDFNDATLTLFDCSKEELKQLDNIHSFYHPEAARNVFLLSVKSGSALEDFEMEVRSRDGKIKYCLITANASDTAGEYNMIVRDITERKQAEELRKARDVARQSSKMKEQFIASISHEMRTPMNAILGMSNLLAKTDMPEEQASYVSNIKQSSEILLGIINDILEISTLQNGKIQFEYKDFDLYKVLSNLVNVMQYKVNEKDLSFKLEIAPDVPQVIIGDKLRLNQILYNLVGNAVKFTDSGFVKIRVLCLPLDRETFSLKFEIEDTGLGIPGDKLDAVFDSFTRIRTKERLYEGTGLGLSIAKNLVKQQAGHIGATSIFGKGSTFFFELAFQHGKASQVQEGIGASTPSNIKEDLEIELLLVEDHKMNQLVARKTLERQWSKIKITVANNGQEAIHILEKKAFDIILMDIQMPIMDGFETTHYIRNNMPPEIAGIPILAMTAHAHIAKDEKFKEYGMDDFVLKPFEPSQLFEKITKYTTQS